MSDAPNIHRGMSLREALAAALALGCVVEEVRRTGELRVRHPSRAKTVKVNGRRKDVGRALVVFLRGLN